MKFGTDTVEMSEVAESTCSAAVWGGQDITVNTVCC